jgi:hypothetical protein
VLLLPSLKEEFGGRGKVALAAPNNALHGGLVPQKHWRSISPLQGLRAKVQQKLHFPGLKHASLRSTLDKFPNQRIESM